jgi:peptide/nickel transport system substrate-binding protein
VPPFDNVDVRRAVNYALDRNSLAGLAGGPGFAQPSCQILPPNFDGYRRYCPYTIAPKPDGTYTGPDLAKARRLVATSGTKGQRVTVWILQSFAPVAAYLVSALNRIGYRARLKIFPGKNGKAYFNGATDSRRKVQAFGMLWSADYPAPGGTITPTLSCGSFHPHTPGQSNFAEFCDRKIDAEIARARALQTTDRPAASRLWRKVDHDLVDQAPWAVQTTSQSIWFVSRRVRNFQYHPVWGPLLDQIWVK